MGEVCPRCGGKLAKSAARVAWCVEHTPVEDWLSWNAAARIILPAYGVVLAMILLLEGLSGGGAAVQRLLQGGLMLSMLILLLATAFVLLIVLHLQGDDVIDCVVDSRGVHVQQYLTDPTPLKLLLRCRSPQLMQQADASGETPLVLISQKELAWKDIARVQLWPEKNLVLLYAPTWWMRLALYCTPFTWEDTLAYMRDKVGRKKNLLLPRELVAPPKPKAAKAKPQVQPEPQPQGQPEPQPQQLTFADVSLPIVPEEPPAQSAPEQPPAQSAPEQPQDFIPLADVLAEIKASEAQKAQAQPAGQQQSPEA